MRKKVPKIISIFKTNGMSVFSKIQLNLIIYVHATLFECWSLCPLRRDARLAELGAGWRRFSMVLFVFSTCYVRGPSPLFEFFVRTKSGLSSCVVPVGQFPFLCVVPFRCTRVPPPYVRVCRSHPPHAYCRCYIGVLYATANLSLQSVTKAVQRDRRLRQNVGIAMLIARR